MEEAQKNAHIMPAKKPSPYKLGRLEGEVDYTNIHSIIMYYFNHIMYWTWRILALVLGSIGAVKILIKVFSR